MLVKRQPDIKASEITDESMYLNRRAFMKMAGGAVAGVTAGIGVPYLAGLDTVAGQTALAGVAKGPFGTTEKMNTVEQITTYNNFYEFGVDKSDPARYAGQMKIKPWSVAVEGLVSKPGAINLEDLIKPFPLQERVYRMRCVEAWSMVIPWVGFPLGDLIKRLEPSSKAKYVSFTTLQRPSEMPGQRRNALEWPYVEGLRMDEALHPLTILAVGLYGKTLPNQNGAPLRLVVPWKYGFKGIKSIVKISFIENQPTSSWTLSAPDEYGFYSNVNPEVDHPRWTQASERRIGEFFRRKTLMFNGYGDQVAALYRGMDLRKSY